MKMVVGVCRSHRASSRFIGHRGRMTKATGMSRIGTIPRHVAVHVSIILLLCSQTTADTHILTFLLHPGDPMGS